MAKRPVKKTKVEEKIEDRLTRCSKNEAEDIIYVGLLVERVLCGEFGAILKALTAGRIASELSDVNSHISAERKIGRLEMANNIWFDLEQFVLDKDKVKESLSKDEMPVETFNFTP